MIVIVFDFDDTLHATSHLYINQPVDSNQPAVILPELADSVAKLLSAAKLIADVVYIITNSEKGWVESCAQKHLPGCEELFQSVEIITKDYIEWLDLTFEQWKPANFIKKLSPHFQNEESHHLISFGDAMHDRMAAMAIQNKFPNVIVKNLLLLQNPSLEILLVEHKMIEYVLTNLSLQETPFDLQTNINFISNQPESSGTSITQKSESKSDSGTGTGMVNTSINAEGGTETEPVVSPTSISSSSLSSSEEIFSLEL